MIKSVLLLLVMFAFPAMADDFQRGTSQNLVVTSSVARSVTDDFGAYTTHIRVSSTVAGYLAFGVSGAQAFNATASTGSYLPANTIEIIRVPGGSNIDMITIVGPTGILSVTELSK